MRGLVTTRSVESCLPTVAPAALFAFRTASRKAQAASKAAPASAPAGTPAKSADEGHGARWMLRAPVVRAKPQDQTSSVT